MHKRSKSTFFHVLVKLNGPQCLNTGSGLDSTWIGCNELLPMITAKVSL
jgi:hypothetical protein